MIEHIIAVQDDDVPFDRVNVLQQPGVAESGRARSNSARKFFDEIKSWVVGGSTK